MSEPQRQTETEGLVDVDRFMEMLDAHDDGLGLIELVDGEVIQMSPAKPRHGKMIVRLGASLLARVPSHWSVIAEGGLRLENDNLNYRVPDIVITASELTTPWVEEPKLVVEVVSKSTKKVDSGFKLGFYASLPSVDEILLVEPNERDVKLFQRDGNVWTMTLLSGSDEIVARTLTSPIPLDEVYGPLGL